VDARVLQKQKHEEKQRREQQGSVGQGGASQGERDRQKQTVDVYRQVQVSRLVGR
jgi:hypothetical protein